MRQEGFDPSGSFSADGLSIQRTDRRFGVSVFRLKSFLVDYRHFSGQERANFLRMLKLLQKLCNDERVGEFVAQERANWKDAGQLSGWHNNFVADDVIDAIDKEEVFHTKRTGKGMHVPLADVKARLDDPALWAEVSLIAYTRMLSIRNVNYFLQPLLRGRCFLQLSKPK